jgi:hypothetical protein
MTFLNISIYPITDDKSGGEPMHKTTPKAYPR